MKVMLAYLSPLEGTPQLIDKRSVRSIVVFHIATSTAYNATSAGIFLSGPLLFTANTKRFRLQNQDWLQNPSPSRSLLPRNISIPLAQILPQIYTSICLLSHHSHYIQLHGDGLKLDIKEGGARTGNLSQYSSSLGNVF